ncbi:DUF881 domain-containing protein [Brevibacterium sp. CS2]|uniref:DUF881 domain-containing protein n=1 Tax=Brevibacterium sp. CS2 TaxID=2575923 RepID=UPI0010C77439|nr:DUF881 domain-containing protein [Brevibacterium sp. CS2]QCP06048.1 DUF881 domain-containing protein [Brevibacterium sp. CS2]
MADEHSEDPRARAEGCDREPPISERRAALAASDTRRSHSRRSDPARARRFAERRISSRESDRPRTSFSESLLESLWNRTPEPDYEIAASKKVPRTTGSRMMFGAVAVVLGLTFTVAVVQLTRTEDGERGTADFLAGQIESRQQDNERLASDIEERTAALASAQRSALTEEQSRELDALARTAGAEELTGPGTIITLRDQDRAEAEDDPRQTTAAENRVQDIDLQIVVNGLNAVGAQGIAINGHRLTSASAIRSAGSAILVNFDPLEPPYEVVAIGDEELGDRFLAAPAADYLTTIRTEYGIGSQISREERTLPAAEVSAPRFAERTDPGPEAIL